MKNQNFTLTEEEKKQLLNISRQTLQEYIIKTQTPKIDKKDLTKNLLTHAGAFVTLNKQKDLRGCIGRFTANEPAVLVTLITISPSPLGVSVVLGSIVLAKSTSV